MKKHYWYLELTDIEVKALAKGLKTYFRFYLALSCETVAYDESTNCLSVRVPNPDACPNKNLLNEISIYINGFVCANEI